MPSMALDDVIFWVALTVFGTGLYMMPDHQNWGIIFVALGLAGLIYSVRAHLRAGTANRRWGIVMIVAALLICAAVGFDYYDRHYPQPSPQAAWDNYQLQIEQEKTFSNMTVNANGHEYDGCYFENVTIAYRGNAPTRFINSRYKGKIGFSSDNAAINEALGILQQFQMVPNPHAQPRDLGPSAP